MKFVSGSRQSSAGVPPAQSTKTSEDAAETAALPSLVRAIGKPTTPNETPMLAGEDKFQFQWWAHVQESAKFKAQIGGRSGIAGDVKKVL